MDQDDKSMDSKQKSEGCASSAALDKELHSKVQGRHKLKRQPKSQYNPEICDMFTSKTRTLNTRNSNFYSESPRVRRKLPVTVKVSNYERTNKEEEPVLTELDDFEYFCNISQSKHAINLNYQAKSNPELEDCHSRTEKQRQWQIRSQSLLYPNEQSPNQHSNSHYLEVQQYVGNNERRNQLKCLRSYTQDYSDGNISDRFTFNQRKACSSACSERVLNNSHNSSTISLSHSNRASYSPNRFPIIPRPPPRIRDPSCKECPLGTAISQDALAADNPDLVEFKVQVVGSPGVGKTSICKRLANLNGATIKPDLNEDMDDEFNTVSIRATLYGKFFNVYFVETVIHAAQDSMNIEVHDYVDAYLLVYAIDDASSYEFIKRVLFTLSQSMSQHELAPAAFIIAANKSDLVRAREINSEEGIQFAQSQDAKFIELSASLDHMIPELLLTIIKHLNKLDSGSEKYQKYLTGTRESSRKISVKMKSYTSTDNLFAPRKITNMLKKYFSQSLFKSEDDE